MAHKADALALSSAMSVGTAPRRAMPALGLQSIKIWAGSHTGVQLHQARFDGLKRGFVKQDLAPMSQVCHGQHGVEHGAVVLHTLGVVVHLQPHAHQCASSRACMCTRDAAALGRENGDMSGTADPAGAHACVSHTRLHSQIPEAMHIRTRRPQKMMSSACTCNPSTTPSAVHHKGDSTPSHAQQRLLLVPVLREGRQNAHDVAQYA